MIKYNEPVSLSKEVQSWISDINGKIKYARAHPNTDQYGVNPEFWQRLIAPDIQTISDLKGNQVSHKMSWGEKDGKIYIYPEVQMINGSLVDLSEDRQKAFESALQNNNFIIAPNEEIADQFTRHYKESNLFKGFRKFQKDTGIDNVQYSNAITKNIEIVNKIYRQLLNSGMSSVQAAAIIGNLTVESLLNPDKREINGNGIGLAQWTSKSRVNNMFGHVNPNYLNDEIGRQIDFLIQEIKDKDIWNKPNKNKKSFEVQKVPYNMSIEEATKAFMEGFENPRADSSHYKDRLQVAKYILSPDFQTQYQYKLFKSGGKLNYLNYIN